MKKKEAKEPEIVLQAQQPRKTEKMRPDLLRPIIPFEPRVGEYHLIEVDNNGNEIAGTDFSVGKINYERTYKDSRSFKVKKNPQ